MSKIIIVDENDNQISVKERSELECLDVYRATLLWVTNSKGEILLAKRAITKKYDPGKWGPAVAGTVEEGESYKESIIKEAKEELGLERIDMKMGPKIRIEGENGCIGQWFTSHIDKELSEFNIQTEEVEKIGWFNKDDILEKFKTDPSSFVASAKNWLKLFIQ